MSDQEQFIGLLVFFAWTILLVSTAVNGHGLFWLLLIITVVAIAYGLSMAV